MFFWNSYPFVRLSIILILGVIGYDHFHGLWKWPIITLAVSIIIYIIAIYLSDRIGFYKLRLINGILSLFIVFFIGGFLVKNKYHDHPEFHYKNLRIDIKGFSGVIISPVNERKKHFRYEISLKEMIAADSIITTAGKIHLYVQKDSATFPLQYGDRVNVYGRFYPIQEPGNPAEFNYREYLERQNIYAHAFVKSGDISVGSHESINPILEWSYSLRANANQLIDTLITQPRENGIAKALLLGIKDHLDNDLKKAYSAAGAMHVLAVSGLHVGIIFLIIKLLFGKLREYGLWGKYTFGGMSVLVIWLYASVTGLSPSVLRAATMFSLVAIGEASIRETNIYNSLGLAAFILMLFDPYFIYSVGFQLSFAAVIGIVYLQPKLYRIIEIRPVLLDKAWAITCVSIAAQLATFPLTAYYFHQFPTYFLISNLIVIPASFLMLTGGIIMLILGSFSLTIGRIWGELLQKFIWSINEIISYIHVFPSSLIEWIYLDWVGLLFTYAIVFTLIAALHFGAFRTLIITSLLILGQLAWTWVSHERQSLRNELIFYELSDRLAIDYIQGHSARLYIEFYTEEELELLSYQIDPSRLISHLKPIRENIRTFEEANFAEKDVIQQGFIGNKKFIIFDSTTFHLKFNSPLETDYIIVNNGAIKNLKWLKEHFIFEGIIISTKNSITYSKKMKKQGAELGIKLHSLKEDGAFRICL